MDETQNQAVGVQALSTDPPLPLPNMDDLQEQLRQKERMFQRACRAAREAELRVEHLENIIDSKREILDGSNQKAEEDLQKRELLQQIERLKGESELARREVKDLKDSMKKICEVHDKEKATLKEEVDNERRRKEDSIRDKEKLEQENASLKKSASEANSQLAILQAQFAELQQEQRDEPSPKKKVKKYAEPRVTRGIPDERGKWVIGGPSTGNAKVKETGRERRKKEIDELLAKRRSCQVHKGDEPPKSEVKKLVMDYSLPSERKKPSAEDRMLQAMCERLEREKKKSGERKRGAINDANEDSDASIPVVSPPKKTAAMKEKDV